MLFKRTPVPGAFSARLQLGTLSLLLLLLLMLTLGPVAHGQDLTSPCPSVFNYRLDQNTTQVYGYLELQKLRIGQVVKLEVDLSFPTIVSENNVGSIKLVKSREKTFRDIYNNQPAQYRVNFPFRNVIPNVLQIRVNGKPICYGQKAKGQIVTTVNLDHTLVTQLQTLSKPSVSNQNAIELEPVQQTPRPFVYTEPRREIVRSRPQPVEPEPQPIQPRPQPVARPQEIEIPRSQLQSNDVCGVSSVVSSQLSINGVIAPKGQFPWAVPLFVGQGAAKKPRYICGSTIISRYHLLTAAHCMYDGYRQRKPFELMAVPGMYNIDNFLEPDIQRHFLSAIVIHPDFYSSDDGQTEFDIAVLVLQKPIVFNDLVRPICLWDGNDNLEEIVGRTGFVSGWGITESGAAKRPSYVMAKVLPKNQCQRKLGHIFDPSKSMFCADGLGGVPCTGDSGSGLVLKQGSRFYMRGIVSVGQYNLNTYLCDTTKFVVYTDIAPFRFWLANVMKKQY